MREVTETLSVDPSLRPTFFVDYEYDKEGRWERTIARPAQSPEEWEAGGSKVWEDKPTTPDQSEEDTDSESFSDGESPGDSGYNAEVENSSDTE